MRAVELQPGETVVVSAAAGGVGVVAAQPARLQGARVIGTAGAANAGFLRSLGVADGAAASRYGVRTAAQEQAGTPVVWEHLAELAAAGRLTVPVQAVYPLERVREACEELAARRTRGKIVLRLDGNSGL